MGSYRFFSTLYFQVDLPSYFPRLAYAWKVTWREGVFPNPANVSLHLDLNETPPLRWCLTLANLWVDLLLRRATDFACALFGRHTSTKQVMAVSDGLEGSQKPPSSSSSSSASSPLYGEELHVSDVIFFWICQVGLYLVCNALVRLLKRAGKLLNFVKLSSIICRK